MTEEKLLSDTVRLFSELYPEKRGQFFHVSNERKTGNPLEVMRAKSIGIFSGIADLLFFENHNPSGYNDIAIELKVPESRHKRKHIEAQIEWAKIWEREGRVWRLCINKEDAISCTEGRLKGLTIADVEAMLQTQKTDTIKF